MATVVQAHSPIIVPVLLQDRSTIELSAYTTALADTASYLPSARNIVLPNDRFIAVAKVILLLLASAQSVQELPPLEIRLVGAWLEKHYSSLELDDRAHGERLYTE